MTSRCKMDGLLQIQNLNLGGSYIHTRSLLSGKFCMQNCSYVCLSLPNFIMISESCHPFTAKNRTFDRNFTNPSHINSKFSMQQLICGVLFNTSFHLVWCIVSRMQGQKPQI